MNEKAQPLDMTVRKVPVAASDRPTTGPGRCEDCNCPEPLIIEEVHSFTPENENLIELASGVMAVNSLKLQLSLVA